MLKINENALTFYVNYGILIMLGGLFNMIEKIKRTIIGGQNSPFRLRGREYRDSDRRDYRLYNEVKDKIGIFKPLMGYNKKGKLTRHDASDFGELIAFWLARKTDIPVCEVELATKKEQYYTQGDVKAFVAPKWTLEYCIALSCLCERFHKSIYYGKKIKNSDMYSLTDKKIEKANQLFETDYENWKDLTHEECAFNTYRLMLNDSGSSDLKAIVAQCLATVLQWEIYDNNDNINQENMFDHELYRMTINSEKRKKMENAIEQDKYLRYIVDAIRYATNNYSKEND